MNKEIAVYDNTVSARTYLSYIAEQAGGIAVIGRDGKLCIKTIGESSVTLPLKLFKTFKWGEKFKITRVRYDDGTQLFEKGDTTGNTVYISQDNMYIVDQDQINNIYNTLKGLEFYSFEGESIIDPALDTGDIVVIDGKNVIYQGSMQFSGRWIANIESKIQCKAKEETTTRTPSQKTINRRVETSINQIDGKITQLTQETTEHETKLTQQEQDINSIKQKVENVVELTQICAGNKTIILANCLKGELVKLRIKGNNTVFDCLYLNDTVTLNDELYLKGDSEITVTDDKSNTKIYELGIDDVLRKNGNIYDEYILEKGQAKVIRRINADGSVKESESVKNIGTLKIELAEGTNIIQIKNYSAEIEVKYVVKSEYTDVFAEKVEMHTLVEQTAGQIMTEVNKKVDDAEIGTKITQNYESVQIAWNSISEFIKFLNAMLQILDKNQKLLMSLDKTGMHFFNSTGKEIGNIGINNAEVSFYINGDVSGSSMSWGINKTINGEMKYFPVFSYSGYNTDSGTEFGGKFLLEAPLIMQEKTLFLGQDMNSSYIQGQETDNRKKTTIGNTDDLYVYNSAGNLILVLNSSYLKLYEQLEMYADPTATGGYDFNFMDNSLIGIDSISASGEISGNNGTFNDIPNSDNVRRFNNTGTDYLIAVLKSSAGGGSIYCQNANSDKKFKKNIKNAEISAVDTIMKIKHRQYDWKSNGKHEYVGYIAQELEKINPGLVNKIKEDDGETYLLNEKALVAMATKAIQEQQQQIEELKKEINKLKGDS